MRARGYCIIYSPSLPSDGGGGGGGGGDGGGDGGERLELPSLYWRSVTVFPLADKTLVMRRHLISKNKRCRQQHTNINV